MKDIDTYDEIRNLLKDKEDISYKVIDKLVDILEKQDKKIRFLAEIALLDGARMLEEEENNLNLIKNGKNIL